MEQAYTGITVTIRQVRPKVQKPTPQQLEERRLVTRIVNMLPSGGGEVLEVTGGPAPLAIPLSRTGQMHITALYPSDSALDAARRSFEKARVRIEVHKGSPAHMPFPDGTFDFVICRAPMKQFRDPVGVLREMRRVLRPGRRGIILNLRRDVPRQAVTRYIESQHPAGVSRLFAYLSLRMQQRSAYTLRQFEGLLSQVPFGSARIDGTPIGVEVWFER